MARAAGPRCRPASPSALRPPLLRLALGGSCGPSPRRARCGGEHRPRPTQQRGRRRWSRRWRGQVLPPGTSAGTSCAASVEPGSMSVHVCFDGSMDGSTLASARSSADAMHGATRSSADSSFCYRNACPRAVSPRSSCRPVPWLRAR